MIQNSFVNRGIVIGIIVIVVIIIGLVSFSSDTKTNDDLTSETNVPAESIPRTGTDYSVELSESISIRNVP